MPRVGRREKKKEDVGQGGKMGLLQLREGDEACARRKEQLKFEGGRHMFVS